MVNKIIVFLIFFLWALPSVYASDKSVTSEITHPVADHESKNDARRICFLNAKKKLISDVADFFQKQGTGEIAALERADMEQYLSVLLEIKATSETWRFVDNRLVLQMVTESILDPAVLEKQVLGLDADPDSKHKIKKDQERLKTLEDEYVALEKQLASANDDAGVSLLKEIQVISSEIDQIENVKYVIETATKQVADKVFTGMTIDELIKIAGQPRATATCEKPDFMNYGNIWVWINNGIVIGKIPMEKWAGPCYRYSLVDRGENNNESTSAPSGNEDTEQPKFIIYLKSGQPIYTSTYYKVNDVVYYKKYGGIIGIEDEKIDSIKEVE